MRYDELIKIREMRAATVLAGPLDPSIEIEGAEVVEEPAGLIEIKAKQMIITSGILLQQEGGLEQFIGKLAGAGIAGILVQTGPYIEVVSEAAVQIAERAGIFLITLPFPGEVCQIISRIYYEKLLSEERKSSTEAVMMELLYGNGDRAIAQLPENSFEDGRSHAVIFAAFDHEQASEEEKKFLLRTLLQHFRKYENRLYLEEADGIVMIVLLESSRKYMEEIDRKRAEVSEHLFQIKGKTVSYGVSSVFTRKEGIRGAVREAKKTYQILRVCRVQDTTRYYDNIGIYRIFFAVNNEAVLEELENEILGKLIRYDKECDGELLSTLRVYLEKDCCVKTTADEMFVHRNTIKYRISQIAEILEKDLKDVTVQFNLRMAFRIRKYLGKHSDAAVQPGNREG